MGFSRKSGEFCPRKVAFGAALLISTTAAHAACPPQYNESWVAPQFSSATHVLNQALAVVDRALSSQLQVDSERFTSAIAVLTKQKAVSGNQISDSTRTAAQQVANGMAVLSETERVQKARLDFGGEFGQGYSPCKVYAGRQVIASRDADMMAERRVRVMSEINAAPGRYVDPLHARNTMVEANRNSCTQSQVDSGFCDAVGQLPGASVSMATMFMPAMESEQLYEAKVAFVNNMVGLPDGPVPTDAGATPASAAYALAKARKDALTSPAETSLKEIQLDYSGVNGAETGIDIPLALHFANEVKRYSGNSPEYDAWAQVLAAQTERGTLVELLKVKALDLAIQEKQYRQYERMEAILSALVAQEVQTTGLAAQTSRAAEEAAKQNVKNAVQ